MTWPRSGYFGNIWATNQFVGHQPYKCVLVHCTAPAFFPLMKILEIKHMPLWLQVRLIQDKISGNSHPIPGEQGQSGEAARTWEGCCWGFLRGSTASGGSVFPELNLPVDIRVGLHDPYWSLPAGNILILWSSLWLFCCLALLSLGKNLGTLPHQIWRCWWP